MPMKKPHITAEHLTGCYASAPMSSAAATTTAVPVHVHGGQDSASHVMRATATLIYAVRVDVVGVADASGSHASVWLH